METIRNLSLTIKIPRKKHIKRWENSFYKKSYTREEKKMTLRQFSTNPKACIEWKEFALAELEDFDEKVWKEIEDN